MPTHAHSSITPAPCRPPNPPYHLAPPQVPITSAPAGAAACSPARQDGPFAAELPGFDQSHNQRPRRSPDLDPNGVGEA